MNYYFQTMKRSKPTISREDFHLHFNERDSIYRNQRKDYTKLQVSKNVSLKTKTKTIRTHNFKGVNSVKKEHIYHLPVETIEDIMMRGDVSLYVNINKILHSYSLGRICSLTCSRQIRSSYTSFIST